MEAIKEIVLLMPDSLIFGSFVLGTTTLSYSHTIFFFSLLESLFFLGGLQSIFSFINGKEITQCGSKFYTLIFGDLFNSPSANNISQAVYLISVAASYFINIYYNLSDELVVLDPSYTNTMTIMLLAILTIIYASLRLFFCDSMQSVFLGLFFGVILGTFLHYQNIQIFGRDSINFLGIPLLRNKSASGQPIYLCTQ